MHCQSCLVRKSKRCSVMKFCTMIGLTLLCTYNHVTAESENRVLLMHADRRQRDFVELEASCFSHIHQFCQISQGTFSLSCVCFECEVTTSLFS